jgi:hypothetical protein
VRTRVWKRVVTIAIVLMTIVMLGGIQPMFFGVKTPRKALGDPEDDPEDDPESVQYVS